MERAGVGGAVAWTLVFRARDRLRSRFRGAKELKDPAYAENAEKTNGRHLVLPPLLKKSLNKKMEFSTILKIYCIKYKIKNVF